jgi:hypothetical protein
MKQFLKLQGVSMPKMLADLTHSNQFLKVFSIVALVISAFIVLLCLMLSHRPPTVIAFAGNGSALKQGELPKAEDQIREAIKAYLELRYKWTPKDVVMKLTESEAFIAPSSVKAFRVAVGTVAKFALEKQVEQRIFPDPVEVSLEKRLAVISGDRITSIQGIRAAGLLKLILEFDFGVRTDKNPWGIYITKEREE